MIVVRLATGCSFEDAERLCGSKVSGRSAEVRRAGGASATASQRARDDLARSRIRLRGDSRAPRGARADAVIARKRKNGCEHAEDESTDGAETAGGAHELWPAPPKLAKALVTGSVTYSLNLLWEAP